MLYQTKSIRSLMSCYKNNRLLLLLSCFVITIFFTTLTSCTQKSGTQSISQRPQQSNISVQLKTYIIKKESEITKTITIPGFVTPNKTTIITAPFDGHIKKYHVKVGDIVSKNAPLVTMSESLIAEGMDRPLRSPFEGTIVQIERKEGEYVPEHNYDRYIMRIDDLSKMFVEAEVPEIDVIKLKSDLPATIKISGINNKSYKGIVRSISISSIRDSGYYNNSSINYKAVIEFLDTDKDIRPDLSAVVDITVISKKDVLAIRHEYVQEQDGKFFVTLLKNKEVKNIELGIENDDFVEVISGLKEGDEVLQTDYFNIEEQSKD